jgi:SAM-dependent methyltransferase
MKIINLGCGTKVSPSPDVINIDWSIYFRIKSSPVLRSLAVPLFLNGARLNRFRLLPGNIMAHNLKRGMPFDSDSVDVVYHSHFLEHLDREVAIAVLGEIRRVLRPGGFQRIVVPDLEQIIRAYMSHLDVCERDATEAAKHDAYIEPIIGQAVRREGFGTSQQKPVRRLVENLFLGDARRRGETHQWMYDKFNLSALLMALGYTNVRVQTYDKSSIPGWCDYGLDLDSDGNEYKPASLYVETQK